MEKIDCEIKIFDNYLEVIPKEKIKPNSIYEIKIKNICSTKKHKAKNLKIEILTQMKPCYSTVYAVNSIISAIEFDEKDILYNIREASKIAQYYKNNINENNIPNEVAEFVKYKAARECLINYIIGKTTTSGLEGKLEHVSFSNKFKISDLNKLLDRLDKEIAKWEEKLKSKIGVKSLVVGSNSVGYNPIGLDIDRGLI